MKDTPISHLNQVHLARRWTVSPRTLERWRWLGQGPSYLKVGGRVVYRLEDVEAFEAGSVRTSRGVPINTGSCAAVAMWPASALR